MKSSNYWEIPYTGRPKPSETKRKKRSGSAIEKVHWKEAILINQLGVEPSIKRFCLNVLLFSLYYLLGPFAIPLHIISSGILYKVFAKEVSSKSEKEKMIVWLFKFHFVVGLYFALMWYYGPGKLLYGWYMENDLNYRLEIFDNLQVIFWLTEYVVFIQMAKRFFLLYKEKYKTITDGDKGKVMDMLESRFSALNLTDDVFKVRVGDDQVRSGKEFALVTHPKYKWKGDDQKMLTWATIFCVVFLVIYGLMYLAYKSFLAGLLCLLHCTPYLGVIIYSLSEHHFLLKYLSYLHKIQKFNCHQDTYRRFTKYCLIDTPPKKSLKESAENSSAQFHLDMLHPHNINQIYHLIAYAIEVTKDLAVLGQSMLFYTVIKAAIVVFSLTKSGKGKKSGTFNLFPNM
jgi:hypothetical protein